MTVSQEGCQHGADHPGLGELVKFSAEPQLAELRCLDGGAAQGIGLSLGAAAAAAGTNGSAAAASHTGAQLDSQDYQLIQHVQEPSLDDTAGYAEGNLSAMPELQTDCGPLIDDVQPVTKLNDTVLVEDTSQVNVTSGHPIAALFARVACPSASVAFASAGCRPFFFCLVLSPPFPSAPSAVLDLLALHSLVVQGSSFVSVDSYRC